MQMASCWKKKKRKTNPKRSASASASVRVASCLIKSMWHRLHHVNSRFNWLHKSRKHQYIARVSIKSLHLRSVIYLFIFSFSIDPLAILHLQVLVKAIPKWRETERRVKIRLSIWSRDYRLKSLLKRHARSYAAALVIKRFAIKAVYKYQTLPRYGEGAPWKMYIGSCWTEERRGSSRAVPCTTRGMRQYRFSVSARRRRTSARQETLLEAISISHLVARNLCPSRRPCHPRDLNWIAVGARRADERELISRLISENTLKRPRCVRENVGRRMRRAVVRARGIIRFIRFARAERATRGKRLQHPGLLTISVARSQFLR